MSGLLDFPESVDRSIVILVVLRDGRGDWCADERVDKRVIILHVLGYGSAHICAICSSEPGRTARKILVVPGLTNEVRVVRWEVDLDGGCSSRRMKAPERLWSSCA